MEWEPPQLVLFLGPSGVRTPAPMSPRRCFQCWLPEQCGSSLLLTCFQSIKLVRFGTLLPPSNSAEPRSWVDIRRQRDQGLGVYVRSVLAPSSFAPFVASDRSVHSDAPAMPLCLQAGRMKQRRVRERPKKKDGNGQRWLCCEEVFPLYPGESPRVGR